MSRNARIPSYLILLLVLYMLPIFAAQEPREVAPAEALKARVVLYYGSLEKGDKTTALDLVAPESKNDFAHMNYDGLQEFRILDMRLSDAGDTATVRLQRTDSFPGFPQLLDHQTVDTWKQIGGKWCVLLPVPKENEVLDTPFGKMTFARRSQNDQQAEPPALPQKQVSPQEAKQALQKAMVEANKKKSSDRDKKPEDKKSEDQAAPKPNPPN